MATPAKTAASAASTVLVTCLKPFTDITTGKTHTKGDKQFSMPAELAAKRVKLGLVKLVEAEK